MLIMYLSKKVSNGFVSGFGGGGGAHNWISSSKPSLSLET
jgi:hypothetical protein